MGKIISHTVQTEMDIILALSKLRTLMMDLDFNHQEMTRSLTATSELARNILKYAEKGEISFQKKIVEGQLAIEVITKDTGPGIPDIDLAMQDQYSTSNTLGLGLPGVRRLVDDFDIQTEVGIGTMVLFRIWRAH